MEMERSSWILDILKVELKMGYKRGVRTRPEFLAEQVEGWRRLWEEQVWGQGKVRNSALDAISLSQMHIRYPGGAVSRQLAGCALWDFRLGPQVHRTRHIQCPRLGETVKQQVLTDQHSVNT